MNEPLITKHGAASLLGITKAALMKLVRADRVPYVKMPGSGDVRFDGSDLQKWIEQHKGGDMTTATAKRTERESMQEQIRNLPNLIEERKQLQIDRAEIQKQVDSGHLTERALVPADMRINAICKLIGDINNRFPQELINNCPDQELAFQKTQFNEQRQTVDRELKAKKRVHQEEALRLESMRKDLEKLQSPDSKAPYGYMDEYKRRIASSQTPDADKARYESAIGDAAAKYAERIVKLEKSIDYKQQTVKRLADEVQELEARRDELTAEIDRVRSEMVMA